MSTTIQVSDSLHEELVKRKLFQRETYEEVIWDMIEDTLELSEETKEEIMIARGEISEGKIHTLSQVRKELGL